MRSRLAAAIVVLASLVGGVTMAQPDPAHKPAPIVFFDIAGPSLAPQKAFYEAVFGWNVTDAGGVTVPVASPLPGNLRVETSMPDPAERVLYIGVPDINATLAQIKAHGGSTVFGRMVVPHVAIIALFKDPGGNRMGLVEIKDGKPIEP
jgi:predicted enzyme related to lactoylglutathione lyase